MSTDSPLHTTVSTCCYCGMGCDVLIEHDSKRILGAQGDPWHPVNFSRLCSRGVSPHLTGDFQARALYPQLRLSRQMARARSDWENAPEHATGRFTKTIHEYEPDSVAFYISGRLLTEDYYVFNKLARILVGTNSIDNNSCLCMSSAAIGYRRSLGANTPPCGYEDLDCADCVLIVGSNMVFAHSVLFRRLKITEVARPEMCIMVIDPRRTDTCELVGLHLALLLGIDVALLHGILYILLWEDWIDRSFTAGRTESFVNLKELVCDYTPTVVADIRGIDRTGLQHCTERIGRPSCFLSFWCIGLNQPSTGSAKNSALINPHLATGKTGRAGCGSFSLAGQPNAIDGRETGNPANLLPGHRKAVGPSHRTEVTRYWGVEQLPTSPGLGVIELFDAIHDDRVRALWIACTNPVQSLPDQRKIYRVPARYPFVVVQEAFAGTETC